MQDYVQNVTAAKYEMDPQTRKLLGGVLLAGLGLVVMALFLPAPAGGKWEVVGVLMGFALTVGSVVVLLC
jgi:hypothetical protein